MSANTVIQKIQEKATAQAEEILQNGKQRAEQIKKEILEQADARADSIRKRAEKDGEQLLRASAQQAALDMKIALLNHKHQLLMEACKDAKTALCALPQNELLSLYKPLLTEYVTKAGATLQCNAALLASGAEQMLASMFAGTDAVWTLSQTPADISGGFLVATEDYDVDLSFDALLSELFEAHEKEIADVLFADEVKV